MSFLRRSLKAWLIAIPALVLVFFLLFPPKTMHELEETIGWMIIAVLFLGLPLLVAILLFNAIFNRSPAPAPEEGLNDRPERDDKHVWRMAFIGAVLAGIGAAFIQGIIWEVWLIFTGIGGLLGFIAGRVRG